MHRRQRRGQIGVALVGHEHEGAGVGDEGVPAGDADVSVDEALPQLLPGDRDEGGDVVGDRMSDDLTEKLRDLFSRLVDRRRDQMRRALARELDDPFAEIGLHRVNAL